jgi:hypothetical protein
MSYFYIPPLVTKTDYIGNSLSAFNQSFSALDIGLYELSSYTVEEIENINLSIDVLSSSVDTLSSQILPIATQFEAEDAVANDKVMTPARTRETIAKISALFSESFYPNTINLITNGQTYRIPSLTVVPDPPSDPQASFVPDGEVYLNWTTTALLSSRIYRADEMDFSSAFPIATLDANVGFQEYSDTSVSVGNNYYYWITTINNLNIQSEPQPETSEGMAVFIES